MKIFARAQKMKDKMPWADLLSRGGGMPLPLERRPVSTAALSKSKLFTGRTHDLLRYFRTDSFEVYP